MMLTKASKDASNTKYPQAERAGFKKLKIVLTVSTTEMNKKQTIRLEAQFRLIDLVFA